MQCELVAMRCATNQSSLADCKSMRKFFSVQARQENHHALIFEITKMNWPQYFQIAANWKSKLACRQC